MYSMVCPTIKVPPIFVKLHIQYVCYIATSTHHALLYSYENQIKFFLNENEIIVLVSGCNPRLNMVTSFQ